jgi:radical SAM superfamily enzyme YgiQ (UPF0313 family)
MAGDFGLVDNIDQIYPDLSLIFTASILKNFDVNFSVIDANAEKKLLDTIIDRIDNDYDRIIIKTSQATVKLDIETGRYLKNIFPNTKIVLTGRSAYVLNEWIYNNIPEIDEIPLSNMEDYVFQLITGKKQHLVLDDYPLPDYSLFPFKKYHNSNGDLRATIYASRGCIVNCHYCPYSALHNGAYEERSLEKLSLDLEYLLSLGFNHITFRDQFFSCKKERTIAVCDMIKKKNLKFEWVCETRIDSLDKETIDAMADAGMTMVCFGVETRSEDIYKKFERPLADYHKLKELILYLKKKNIITLSLFILGFPDETRDKMIDTFNLAVELDTTYANFNVWNSFIGTKAWNNEYSKYNTINLDLFPLFKRKMNLNIPNRVDPDEVEFIARHYYYKYIEKVKGISDAYDDYNSELKEKFRQVEGYHITKSFLQQKLKDLNLNEEILISV